MSCTDPHAAERLVASGALDSPEWRAHLEGCATCRRFAEALESAAADDATETHPAATVLCAYDEEPTSLSPGVRQWVAAHVERCPACAGALAAVPAATPRPTRAWLRPWPLAAAAGWFLAAVLVWQSMTEAPRHPDPFLVTHSMVLTATRGPAAAPVPSEARVLRLHLVLPDDVKVGEPLRLRCEDHAGRAVFERSVSVAERDERDWPVVMLDRTLLPPGRLRLQVTCPSGAASIFELHLP